MSIDPGRVVRATNTWAFDPHVSHINTCFKISNKEAGIKRIGRESVYVGALGVVRMKVVVARCDAMCDMV